MSIKTKKPFPGGRTFQERGGQFTIHTYSLEYVCIVKEKNTRFQGRLISV